MNSFERVMTALKGGTPDMIPIMEIDILPHVIDKIMPGASKLDFFEKFDIDGISVFYDLLYVDYSKDVKKDCFGMLRNFKDMQGEFPVPIEDMINSKMDPMKFLDNYKMPKPNMRMLDEVSKTVQKFKGKKAVVFITHSSLLFPIFMRGFNNLMTDYYINPEFALRLAQMFTDFFLGLEKMAIEMGVDIILDGEDYAGTRNLWMSPEQLKQFVLPGLRQGIKLAHKDNVPFVKHCDGNITSIIELLVDQDIDCLNPIDPVKGMDLGDIKKRVGDKVALWGNVDCTNLLTFGTPEQVRAATIECIKKAGKGGGYILSSSNTIHEGVPPENFLMMVKTAREFGKYPLEI